MYRMKLLLSALLLLGLSACLKPENPTDPNQNPNIPQINENPSEMTDLVVPDDFSYATTESLPLAITVQGPQDLPVAGTIIRLFDGDPDEGGHLLAKGQTDGSGRWESTFHLAPHQGELIATVAYPGIPHAYRLSIDGPASSFVLGGSEPGSQGGVAVYDPIVPEPDGSGKFNAIEDKFTYMGEYNSQGVPNYLTLTRDNITQDLLDLVANSVPEGAPVPTHNPQYIADSISADTRLKDSAEVWVTFVHEGAGYRNVLGYYTYDLSDPPSTADDIDSLYIIFPNVSFYNGGGGLYSGDKVYLGSFSANTGIGWFLVPNGWSPSSQALSYPGTGDIKFSNKDFNTFTSTANQSHMVLLKDDARQLLLLGFEDINRPSGDKDFNDAVFYITASPYSAIETDGLEETQTAAGPDDDNDQVINVNDDYPNDPDKAFDLYFPGENTFGTISYEDLWPYRGDYDFNDLVVDYQYQAITNVANQVVELKGTFILKAVGAGMYSGFGFSLDVDPSVVSSATGSQYFESIINNAANGLEVGQSKATMIVFDNGHKLMEQQAGRFINTETASPYITPDTIEVSLVFTTPQDLNSLGSAPFNPFIFTQRGRGYEVHLPDLPPTDLADASLFQTGNDATDPLEDRYYKDPLNLPWAIHVPSPFNYPVEKTAIISAHLKFGSWAQNRGTVFTDWYDNKGGYRNSTAIYAK